MRCATTVNLYCQLVYVHIVYDISDAYNDNHSTYRKGKMIPHTGNLFENLSDQHEPYVHGVSSVPDDDEFMSMMNMGSAVNDELASNLVYG